MRSLARTLTACLAFGLACVGLPAAARAGQMIWTVTSRVVVQVELAFFSESRDNAWPGNGRAFDINDYMPRRYLLTCISGETICYGAWPSGAVSKVFWGVGRDNRQACEGCCGVCGVDNPVAELGP
jgi:hypothetical protein